MLDMIAPKTAAGMRQGITGQKIIIFLMVTIAKHLQTLSMKGVKLTLTKLIRQESARSRVGVREVRRDIQSVEN